MTKRIAVLDHNSSDVQKACPYSRVGPLKNQSDSRAKSPEP
jgi:hypothetical protein